jgi:type II secretory pathway pseudopilin PulG
MNLALPPKGGSPRARTGRRAFTLIGMIGVLAVLAILAAVVLPALIRETDKLVADAEGANLQAYADVLQQSIGRNRYIPGQADWAATIAAQLGASVLTVSTNARHQARVFLIDPRLEIGANGGGLPYAQTNFPFGSSVSNNGVLVPPISPRVMIVSTLGAALPGNLAGGTATDFSNLWNTADGMVPSGGIWAGWNGAADDVKVQRVNLSPLFVHLVLGTYQSAQNGYYAVDGASLAAASTNSIEGYFIQGSVLNLYNNSVTTSLDSQQVLLRDSSFVFEDNVWKNAIAGNYLPGSGLNLAAVVTQFLAAPPNRNAANTNGNAQQVAMVSAMMNYMSKYDDWAAGNFTDNSLKNALINNYQPAMMEAVNGLYGGGSFNANYPMEYDPPH